MCVLSLAVLLAPAAAELLVPRLPLEVAQSWPVVVDAAAGRVLVIEQVSATATP